MTDPGYLLDNRRPEANTRFAALAAMFDAWTFRHLEALGLGAGSRVWEVGAGGVNVPRWLAARVGPEGRVLATDLDVTWAADAADGVVEVRRHDVVLDPPPAERFDLVHARLVLVHVREREQALRHMVGALRPGGWLLVEDADTAMQPQACLEIRGPEEALATEVRLAFRKLLADRGADLAFGRKLPRLLREAGLVDVAADGYFPAAHPAAATLELATIAHVREGLLASGLVTPEALAANVANIEAGRVDLITAPMISAWGRKPG